MNVKETASCERVEQKDQHKCWMCPCLCVHVVSMCHQRTTILSIICIRLFVSMEASDQKEKFRHFFGAVLAMPAKCDSFTGAQTHTWHTDGGLCDLCQTSNRCTFVFGYQQTWHQLSRYIHIFFSSLVMRMKKKHANKHRKKKHLQFYQPNSRIFHVLTSLDRLIIRINFTTTNGTAVW